MSRSPVTIGVDLGTTNTVAGMVSGNEPQIIPNEFGDRKTPSVVTFEDSGPIVGRPAKNQAVLKPNLTAQEIKRYIGNDDYTLDISGKEYTPKELSALVLKQIKSDAENYLNQSVENVVITVPANFRSRQRHATKVSGELANLNVVSLINEPTAACLAYGITRRNSNDDTILVFDLGGGTLDISIVKVHNDGINVKAVGGDAKLGGKDWDKRIIEWIERKHIEETGFAISDSLQALQRAKEQTIQAKHEISVQDQTDIVIPFLSGDQSFNRTLSRDKFRELTEDLTRQAIETCDQVLNQRSHSITKVDKVLLAGGATRMPQIYEAINDFFGVEPIREINPDEVVARGAAVKASLESDEQILRALPSGEDEIEVTDIVTNSLGIELSDHSFDPIIHKGEQIPIATTQGPYTTTHNGQTHIEIRVYEGESNLAQDNRLLDRFYLTGIKQIQAGKPKIEVRFRLDLDGILRVTAKNLNTEDNRTVKIENALQSDEEDRQLLKQSLPPVDDGPAMGNSREPLRDENEGGNLSIFSV